MYFIEQKLSIAKKKIKDDELKVHFSFRFNPEILVLIKYANSQNSNKTVQIAQSCPSLGCSNT